MYGGWNGARMPDRDAMVDKIHGAMTLRGMRKEDKDGWDQDRYILGLRMQCDE